MFIGIGIGVTTRAGASGTAAGPTFTVEPAISGTPKVGSTLTGSTGTATGTGTVTYARQWMRDGVAISGATSGTYLLDAADDGATITERVAATDDDGTTYATSAGVAVTYPVAVAAGALADQSYTEDTGDQTVDAAADFTGAVGGTWSVSGGGASIDVSGVVTIPTTSLLAGVTITVSYTNSGGVASSAFQVTVAGTLAAVTNMTGFTKDGVTVSFWDAASGGSAKSMPVCQDALGDYAVIATSAFWFDTDAPSAVDGGGFRHSGLWERPFANASYDQGFEQGLNWGATTSSSSVPYNDTLNTDPGKTGTRVAVAIGDDRSWVKAVRKSGVTFTAADSGNPWEVFGAQVPITVLSEVPQDGFFLPDPSAPEYGVQATEGQINYSVLRSLSPVSGQPVDTGTTRFAAFSDFGFAGERLRRLVMEVTAGNSASGNYASDYSDPRAFELLRLHTNASEVDKRDAMVKMVRYGLWRWTQYKRGLVDGAGSAAGGAGAGQRQGYLPYIALAGFALGRSDILSDALGINSNVVGQPFWVSSDMEGMQFYWYPAPGAGNDPERRNRTVFPQDVGQAWMTQQGDPLDRANSLDVMQRYLPVSSPTICYEAIAIALLQNGPGGLTGEQWLRGGAAAADDTTNRRASVLRWVDTYRALNKPFEPNAGPLPSWFKTHYDTYRDSLLSTSRPARVPLHNIAETNRLTAGSGSFSYDFSPVDLTIRADYPNTRRDLRYSLDGIQFVEVTGCGDTGSVTGLVRSKHYVQERRANSLGTGVWSDNYSNRNSNLSERYTVTPTGSPANAAPAFSVDPKVFYKPYAWPGPWYVEAPGTLAAGIGTLYCGIGYPTSASHPAPTGLYQWQRDDGGWADIAGATAVKYDLDPDDLGLDIRCNVRLTNSSGTCTAVASQTVSIPARPSFSADVILDTKFDATFRLYWPTIFDGIVPSNATKVLDGLTTWSDLPVGSGGLGFDKTGAYPKGSIPLGTLAAGTYRLQTKVVSGMSAQGVIDGTTYDWRRGAVLQDGRLDIQNQSSNVGATVYSSTTIPANPVSAVALLTPVDVTWTHPGGPAWIFNLINTSAGGVAKGDFVYAERMTVTKL
jgi:hypothetical protein